MDKVDVNQIKNMLESTLREHVEPLLEKFIDPIKGMLVGEVIKLMGNVKKVIGEAANLKPSIEIPKVKTPPIGIPKWKSLFETVPNVMPPIGGGFQIPTGEMGAALVLNLDIFRVYMLIFALKISNLNRLQGLFLILFLNLTSDMIHHQVQSTIYNIIDFWLFLHLKNCHLFFMIQVLP